MTDVNWSIEKSKEIISKALQKWPSDYGVAFTGGKDSTVLLHLILSVTDSVPGVMFIDHQLHFEDTYNIVSLLKEEWKLNLESASHAPTLRKLKKEKNKTKQKELSRVLKIKTIEQTVKKKGWNALYVGIRWDEHPARSEEEYVSPRKSHTRIHPILHFSEDDIWEYIKKYNLPYNPLYDKGYRSIGEKPFTKKVPKSGLERDGREKSKEDVMERLRKLGYF